MKHNEHTTTTHEDQQSNNQSAKTHNDEQEHLTQINNESEYIEHHNESNESRKSDDSDKQSKQFVVYFTIAIILIMLIAGISYFLFTTFTPEKQPIEYNFLEQYEQVVDGQENENQYKFNEFIFVRENASQVWTTVAYKGSQPYELSSLAGPKDVEHISLDNRSLELIFNKPHAVFVIDTTFDQFDYQTAKVAQSMIEVGKAVGNKYNILNKNVTSALSASSNPALPIANCEQVTNKTNVIFFKYDNKTEIRVENDCIIVAAPTGDEMIKASDRLLFAIVGILR